MSLEYTLQLENGELVGLGELGYGEFLAYFTPGAYNGQRIIALLVQDPDHEEVTRIPYE